MLSVIVVTGWFELIALTGQSIIISARREAAAHTEAAGTCAAPGHCATAVKTSCQKGCCKNGCRLGADCRCGSASPKPPNGGLLLTAPGCHPLEGASMMLIVPHSVEYRFLLAESQLPPVSPSIQRLAPIPGTQAPSACDLLPETPPPKQISIA